MSIEVANECGIEVDEASLAAVARFALDAMSVHPAAELSMALVDNETMAQLHLHWMDLPGPTDVMSFPMDELTPGGRPDTPDPGPAMLGDIVLCPEFAAAQAVAAQHSVEHELAVLTVHGVLHLLGYDHAEPEEEKAMFGLQGRIIDDWYRARRAEERHRRQSDRDRTLLDRIGFTGDAGSADARDR